MSRAGEPHIDRGSEPGRRAVERLESERVGWLTTVGAGGMPQASPIWFFWDGEEFLVYSLESARVRNVTRHPQVSFHLDGNGLGGDIVVAEGTAAIDPAAPSAAEHPEYLAKYRPVMDEYGWTPEWFAERYPVPLRITPTKFRYW